MDTPPPEVQFTLVPVPSMSTPSFPVHPSTEKRPRRHTISRSDSASGHLSEGCDADDMTEAFDRISSILTSLLQEANEAINEPIDSERPITDSYDDNTDEVDRLPLETAHSQTAVPLSVFSTESSTSHSRTISISSTTSSSSEADESFSIGTPVSLSATTPPMTPKPSEPLCQKEKTALPLSCPMPIVQSPSSMYLAVANYNNVYQPAMSLSDPLAESYKRLDQSLAVVDSLSRDLIPREKNASSFSPVEFIPASLSAFTSTVVKLDIRLPLFILPFLHIPHAFITMIYDTPFFNDLCNLHGILAWCIFCYIASIAMNFSVLSLRRVTQTRQRRHCRPSFVPGAFASVDLIPPAINMQTTGLYPRRNSHRLAVLPRRSSMY